MRFGVFLPGVAAFDAAAFGIGAPEAALMDPQQRLLLEAAAEALAAGGAGASAAGLAAGSPGVGAYVGISSMDYNKISVRFTGSVTQFTSTGASLSVASGRLAFTFGLRGPAVSVDTACSSSLVAAHAAASALALGQCGGALVGGANLCLSPDTPAAFAKAGMLAPDGRCKTLDAAADGYVRAEAVGVLLLQALAANGAATAAAAPLALLAGSAVNQDGRSSGLTAPNGPAQQDVLRAALAAAGLGPGEVCGLQLHGTGTGLGDPIEVGAAAAVFGAAGGDSAGSGGGRPAPLALSTSKTSLGHAEPAAGVVGLLHTLHGARQRAAQPLLHLRSLNPFVEGALAAPGDEAGAGPRGWHLPRQLAGSAGRRGGHGVAVAGVSAFAFQVGAEVVSVTGTVLWAFKWLALPCFQAAPCLAPASHRPSSNYNPRAPTRT